MLNYCRMCPQSYHTNSLSSLLTYESCSWIGYKLMKYIPGECPRPGTAGSLHSRYQGSLEAGTQTTYTDTNDIALWRRYISSWRHQRNTRQCAWNYPTMHTKRNVFTKQCTIRQHKYHEEKDCPVRYSCRSTQQELADYKQQTPTIQFRTVKRRKAEWVSL